MDFSKLLEKLQSTPWGQQWRLLSGVGLLGAGLLALAAWLFSPDYVTLFPTLPEKEAGSVLAALEQNGISHKIGANGSIQVEKTKLYDTRYKLASLGIPKNSGDEPAQPDPPKFGATSAQESAYQQKVKELELARSISSIAGIGNARVHLAIPKSTIFGKTSGEPTASVVLENSRGLSRSQAQAIARLVAGSVPGLPSEKVSIIDSQGKLLGDESFDPTSTPEQKSFLAEARLDYQTRIERLLAPIVGQDGARAEVDVEADFGNEEAVTETWRPNSGEAAIRSQRLDESHQNGPVNGGIPGSASNFPPTSLPPLPVPPGGALAQGGQPATAARASDTPQNGKLESIVNYELDRSVVKSIRKGAKIRKIKAAVLLNSKKTVDKDGNAAVVPFTADELAQMQSLVKEAIGFNEDRGDSVQLINMPFISQPATEVGLPIWRDPFWVDSALVVGKWILALALGLVLIRQAKALLAGYSSEPEAPPPAAPAAAGSEPAAPSMDINSVKQIAQNNPQAVAAVIKGWVEGEGHE